MRFIVRIFAAVLFCLPGFAVAQSHNKILTTEDFAPWKILQSNQISRDGNLATWEENPQQYGDGVLRIKSLPDGDMVSFDRAESARIAAGNEYVAFRISAHYDSTRQAKLDEVSPKDRPGDTLGIWFPGKKELLTFPRLKSFDVPAAAGSWMAYQQEKAPPAPKDTTQTDSTATDSTAKKKEPEPKELPLTLFNPIDGEEIIVASVQDFTVSDSGRLIAMITVSGDSVDSVQVRVFDPQRQQVRLIYEGMGYAESLTFDRTGKKLAFLATPDTGEVKIYSLYGYQLEEAQARKLVDTATSAMPEGWSVSDHGDLSFSRSGNRLFFGIAASPEAEPEDSLLDEEKTRLDVWSWQDKSVQPEQLLDADDERNRTYLSVWFWKDSKMMQLETEALKNISIPGDDDGSWALGYDDDPYSLERSWAYPWRDDIYLVNVTSGESSSLIKGAFFGASLAPRGAYAVYWNPEEMAWMSINTSTQKITNLTGDIDQHFFDEDDDTPSHPYGYGFAGYLEGEQYGVIYDRYDLWKVKMDGSEKAVNLTKGWGRKENVRLRRIRLDYEAQYLPETVMLIGFDEDTKTDGFYTIGTEKKANPTILLSSEHSYRYPVKARDADRLIWRRETYREYPDLYTSGLDFSNPVKLSNTNPQQDDYAWGNVQLVDWTAYDGTELQGLMYTPEDFDPNKEYPMLVYFYEKVSDRMYNYSTPSPSRSIIYPSYYASNGYVIFMPDIVYNTGQPGEDAYNCIVSGTEAMVEQFSWIDESKMALQGQSWGGYQTAYLVTRTDMYACAMAGAPVSNMTSAYGGIRWGSGLSRAFQYERTQSRLGVTLWEDRERYIANSPLFFADKVTTPLLMMHNDADGAVPWYQGIEYFMALRRLQKPTWMLVYNGEAHNLTRWPNRMDLTIRMHQFFDHYLMEEPAPVWMTEGLPAVDKGKETGYELSEE